MNYKRKKLERDTLQILKYVAVTTWRHNIGHTLTDKTRRWAHLLLHRLGCAVKAVELMCGRFKGNMVA